MTIIRRKPHTYSGHIWDFFKLFISKNWNRGKSISDFETMLSQNTGIPFVVNVSFGIHALSIILKYFSLEKEGELLVPGYTAGVVKRSLIEMGVKYKCVDIDPSRGTMCPIDFERKINKNSKAVLVTHLLGNSCDPRIFSIAKEKNLIVIEDCAHAQGAYLNGKPLGSYGDAAFYSFSYSKLVNAYTGGALLTSNKNLYQFALNELNKLPELKRKSLLRKFVMGHVENFFGIPVLTFLIKPFLGSPFLIKRIKEKVNKLTRKKMIDFYKWTNTQAYLGIKQLNNLDSVLRQKERLANEIINKTQLKFLSKNTGDVYYNLITIVPDAYFYHKKCLKYGLDTGIQSSIMEIMASDDELPGCKFAFEHYLLLPNYISLTTKQVKKISDVLNKVDSEYRLENKLVIL